MSQLLAIWPAHFVSSCLFQLACLCYVSPHPPFLQSCETLFWKLLPRSGCPVVWLSCPHCSNAHSICGSHPGAPPSPPHLSSHHPFPSYAHTTLTLISAPSPLSLLPLVSQSLSCTHTCTHNTVLPSRSRGRGRFFQELVSREPFKLKKLVAVHLVYGKHHFTFGKVIILFLSRFPSSHPLLFSPLFFQDKGF